MKKIAIKICLTFFLIILIFGMSFYFCKDSKMIDENILSKKNINGLSMMIETSAGSGDYEKTTLSSWPTDGYIFNATLSKCENGGKLSWDDDKKKVIMVGNISDKCYAYFDKYNFPVISNVISTNVNSDSITVNVTAEKGTNDIVSFYYSISVNDNDTIYVSDGSSVHTFSGLTMNTNYYIKVYAMDSNGKSSNIYTLSLKTKLIYTWSKYDIKETTNYKAQTNSNEGEIYINYYWNDTWVRNGPVVYSNYSIGSDGTFYCYGKLGEVSVPTQYYTGEKDSDGEKIYRALTDEEINSYFKDYIGQYVCSDAEVSNQYESNEIMLIKSNMTSSFNRHNQWLITDSLTAVANGTTKSKGTYIEDVTSDNSNTYPSNGISGSYWYVRK